MNRPVIVVAAVLCGRQKSIKSLKKIFQHTVSRLDIFLYARPKGRTDSDQISLVVMYRVFAGALSSLVFQVEGTQ